jgi:formylmethanofuran dehydrogenase subunit E
LIRYPLGYVPSCGVRCSRCGRPQFDTKVYQSGEYVFCEACFAAWCRERG